AARYDLKQRPSRFNPWQLLLAAWRSRGLISAARKGSTLLLLAVLAAGRSLRAQDSASCKGVIVGSSAPAPAVPFPVGERLTFGAGDGTLRGGRPRVEGMRIGRADP